MKKLLLSLSGLLLISTASFSQTTIFEDDFESGSGNWTLNVGGAGANDWIVNNSYTGTILTSTPTQPVAITNAPTSQYMHIHNATTACAGFGECQAVFLAANGGDKTAEMTSTISTTGMTSVTLDFWYLCMGGGNTYGTVDYSLDGGSTWTSASPNYQGQMQWTSQSLTNAAWDNQPSLKFRLHWIEGGTGSDPAFSVDDFIITGTGGGTNSIATGGSIQPTTWCEGVTTTVQVDFTSSGTFTTGNIYTAELSDATGSFAAPTAIGTLTSTANTGMITGIILGSTPAGTGYRIRVVSSTPVSIGTDNGVDLVIDPCLGIDEEATSIVSIYPNPVSSTLNILFGTASDKEITLFSVVGEKVKSKTTSGLNATFDVSELPSGVYMIQVESNNITITKRVIVR